ncbi:uncharacterized protein LOC127651879 [Xyrauchen texanus]|uniref:uncharacterized protein LOC127651879 n=1 Tax=Xyrauchen texanus TaxID=154827 RepID=UPI0022424055|nr:uncharacterized protein LOC127651879 [Xyrauchen texanus]
MKFISVFRTWIFMSVIRISGTLKNLHGYTGSCIIIPCSFAWAQSNRKYFCRYPCKDEADNLVSSDRSPNGRFRLEDYGNRIFNVFISELQESDSGVYLFGVQRIGLDTYCEVNLTVSKANKHTSTLKPVYTHFSTSQLNPQPVTRSESQPSTIRSFSTPEDIAISPSIQGPLVFTAVCLTVTLIIFGLVLSVWKRQKRMSYSSSVRDPADAEIRDTTCSTQTTAVYEEITDTQQQTEPHIMGTMCLTVNTSPAANQIQEPPLYSTLSF